MFFGEIEEWSSTLTACMLCRGDSLCKIMFESREKFDRILTLLTSLVDCLCVNYSRDQLVKYPNSTKCSEFWGGQKSEWDTKSLAKFQAASIFSTDKFVVSVFENSEISNIGMLEEVLNYLATVHTTEALNIFRGKDKKHEALYQDLKKRLPTHSVSSQLNPVMQYQIPLIPQQIPVIQTHQQRQFQPPHATTLHRHQQHHHQGYQHLSASGRVSTEFMSGATGTQAMATQVMGTHPSLIPAFQIANISPIATPNMLMGQVKVMIKA